MSALSTGCVVVDQSRLWDDLMNIATFTLPDAPYTRRSFSELFAKGREFLKERFVDAGLSVHIDAAGNLIGTLKGTESGSGTVMIGSHSDTVPGGGRFDGVAGVIAALEIARAIALSPKKLRHDLQVVDFLAEEPSEFGLSCIGSRGISGYLEKAMLDYQSPDGRVLSKALDSVGGNAAQLDNATRSDIRAFFELHIEQGPVLEQTGIEIGVVTSIVGIRRIELRFLGEPDHAGTTPMHMRRDAGAAMAATVSKVHENAVKFAQAERGHFVATCGICEVTPGASNVVPGASRIVIDARSEDLELMNEFEETLRRDVASIAAKYRVELESFRILSSTTPAQCDVNLRNLVRESSKDLELSFVDIASGAGHDAAFVSRVAPAAMVFIPCKGGKSHASEEWAEAVDLAKGSNVIIQSLFKFDASTTGACS